MAVNEGQLTLNEIALIEVDSDPSVGGGLDAPVGSLALLGTQTDGKMWIKTGGGVTSWAIIPRYAGGTAFTQGSVPFIDANGLLAQNNTNFFWDNTNTRLAVQNLIISPVQTSQPSATGENSRMQLHGVGTADSQFSMHRYSNDILPANLRLVKSRGVTVGSHVAVTANDILGSLSFRGSDGSLFGLGASISGYVDGVVAANSVPTRLQFSTTPVAGTTVVERMRITAGGAVIIGNGAVSQDITGLGVFPPFQILGTSATQMVAGQYSADTIPAVFNLIKSRGATVNSQALLSSGDEIGRVQFRGSDGVNFQAAASVRVAVDGTAAAGSMPGRLLLMTTPLGSTTPVERMRIDATGLAIFSQGIRLGTETSTVDGNIRYSGTDFEAYQLGGYRSLTGAWISYLAEATSAITTTSATGVLATGMTITPVAGQYIVNWNLEVSATSNNRLITGAIYVGGVLVTDTSRQFFVRTGNGTFTAADIGRLIGSTKVTTNGSQAVEIRWRTSGGTAAAQGRSMTLTEVGS